MYKYYKIIDGKEVYSNCETIQLDDGRWVSNPKEEMILAAGWLPVPPHEKTLEEAKEEKLQELLARDSSDEVNRFYVDGQPMWLTPEERSNYILTLEGARRKGIEQVSFLGITMPVGDALDQLDDVNLYAMYCALNTERLKELIESAESFDELENLDMTEGYPEPPHTFPEVTDIYGVTSDGSAYVDTGLTLNYGYRFEVSCQANPEVTSGDGVTIGAFTSTTERTTTKLGMRSNRLMAFWPANSGDITNDVTGIDFKSPFTYVLSSSGIRITQGDLIFDKSWTTQSVGSSTTPILIFKDGSDAVTLPSSTFIFSVKIFDGETLLRHFTPVIADGTVCLKENVHNMYYFPKEGSLYEVFPTEETPLSDSPESL